jgi:hypothetical protein
VVVEVVCFAAKQHILAAAREGLVATVVLVKVIHNHKPMVQQAHRAHQAALMLAMAVLVELAVMVAFLAQTVLLEQQAQQEPTEMKEAAVQVLLVLLWEQLEDIWSKGLVA